MTRALAIIVAISTTYAGCKFEAGKCAENCEGGETLDAATVIDRFEASVDAASQDVETPARDAAVPTGVAVLRFAIANGVRANPTLTDPLQGAIIGDIFRTVDVTLFGPNDDAAALQNTYIASVDLREPDSNSAPWTSAPLPAGEYTWLGMMDVDGNASEMNTRPDPGDPVTLPRQKFTVIGGETIEATITFELVYN